MQQPASEKTFWFRLVATAIVVSFPWALGLVAYDMPMPLVLTSVTLSGVAVLLVWDGMRVPKVVLGWLRGEPMQDRSSGLFNPEAFATLLEAEEDRCKRYELGANVVVLRLADAEPATLQRVGGAVRKVSRAHDVVACLDERTFAVLAVNSKDASADSLVARLRSALDAMGVSASYGVASRTGSQTLQKAFGDAQRGLITAP